VPYRKKKRPLRGIGVAVGAFCPILPNVCWAMDFQFDQTSDGRLLKILNVIDEFTREALATDVARNIDADGVVSCLERLVRERGAPKYVRFDHGPEFIAYAVADWCRFNGTGTVFIDPGSPWQNAWIESFVRRERKRDRRRRAGPHKSVRYWSEVDCEGSAPGNVDRQRWIREWRIVVACFSRDSV
jgi:putative transposase